MQSGSLDLGPWVFEELFVVIRRSVRGLASSKERADCKRDSTDNMTMRNRLTLCT